MTICLGINKIIDTHLNLTTNKTSPAYTLDRSCNLLSTKPIQDLNIHCLLQDMLNCLESNGLRADSKPKRKPSKQNWRWEPHTEISPKNKSAEVTLERAIVRYDRDNWVNQIPTASGLYDGIRDQHRNMDLAHRIGADEFELIELKVKSNNPLHAAMECLIYTALYSYARIHYPHDMIAKKALLRANSIHWRVLAPVEYYQQSNLGWLEEKLSEGVARFSNEKIEAVFMDFGFTQFPRDFIWPGDEDQLKSATESISTADWGWPPSNSEKQ